MTKINETPNIKSKTAKSSSSVKPTIDKKTVKKAIGNSNSNKAKVKK